jgi:C-terminal processing protease CtpA/Prc
MMIAPLALFAVSLIGVTGEWHSTTTMASRVVEFTFDLTQAGQSITGAVTIQDQVFPIARGVMQGTGISFSALMPSGGRLTPVPFTGTLEGAELHLDMGGVRLTATRIQPTAQAIRIERLSGLFRLWGAIKFFHPYVAHGSIDWDGALLAAIPKVETAAATEAYAAALDAMLGNLKDPETHLLSGPAAPGSAGAGIRRRLVRSGYPHAERDYYTDWEPVDSESPYIIQLPEQVRVVMRTSEPVDSSAGISTVENGFGNSLPSRQQRLLALARFWNTIHYFYGYPGNLVDWDAVLAEFIPIFESAETWRDYVFAIARLASKTNDFHTSVSALWQEFGSSPEVAVSPVEGRSLVTDVGPTVKGVDRGDIVIAVDGEPVERRIKFLLQLYPHSTPQSGLLMIHKLLLAGSEPTIHLRVEKPDGRQAEAVLTRGKPLDWQQTDKTYPVIKRSTPVFGALTGGYGYMDLERLPQQDVNRAFDAVMSAPSLILDVRGGPKSFDEIAARLTGTKVPAALIRRRVWHGPDPAMLELRKTTQYLYPSGQPKYKGRVVVLIDARAISHAEHVCLFLEAAANVTFIGSPTAGADGDVTGTILPGGIEVNFAGQEIRHVDGRTLQRVGILPDVWAEPTIAGIREGRDEVLEKALQFLKTPTPVGPR